MQISTLNRIVNLLLIGSLTVCLVAFFTYSSILELLTSGTLKKVVEAISPAAFTFIVTLFLLPIVVFIGMVVESISSVFRTVLSRIYRNEWVVTILRCRNQVENMEFYRDTFINLYNARKKFKAIKATPEKLKLTAIALWFHSGKPENIEWGLQHYSIYLLASNYLLLVLAAGVIALTYEWAVGTKLLTLGVILATCYFLFHTMIDKYYYVYECIYRHACVVLSEEEPISDQHPLIEIV